MNFNTSDWVCNLMAIDPGSSNLGIAIYSIDLQTTEIISSHAFTISATNLMQYSKYTGQVYGDRYARFEAMRSELISVLDYYRPSLVVCESPFFNRFTPSAFSVLTELVHIINDTVWCFNNHVPFFKVDPPTAKKAVGAKGNAKKDDMTIAVASVRNLLKLENDPYELDEHAIDACAIGYHGYKKYVIGGLNINY